MIYRDVRNLMNAVVRTEAIVKEQQPSMIRNAVIDQQMSANAEALAAAKKMLKSFKNIKEWSEQ